MAKYDWDALKRKYLTATKKCTLKQFALDNEISYRLLREKAVGWRKEREANDRQKTGKIIEKTIERQIDSEVEMNLKHYCVGSDLIKSIEKYSKESLLLPKNISALAKALETIQKVQRIASGVDKEDSGKNDVIADFMEAVINGNDTTNKSV